MKLWFREGGNGGRRLVLIHGLGANADVWLPLQEHLSEWKGRWLAADLRGHGRSPQGGPYGYGCHAADVAGLLEQDEEVVIVGHSMGGVVAMALASGWFGVKVSKVIAFGVKIRWTPDESAKLQQIARSPVRFFERKEQAVERYLKVSGLFGLVDPSSPVALSGVHEENGKWRLAADPASNAVAGPDLEPIVAAMQAPLRLAAGANDPMVNAADMRRFDHRAQVIDGAGHNAQVDRAQALWQLIRREVT